MKSTTNKMTDERNFRSSYYEKVGCYSVEEKKSLNKLLSDNIRNHSKLKQFCLTYTVPATQRGLLWLIILGVLPLHKNSTDYILTQRNEVYEDLLRAVTILQYVDAATSPKHRILYTMWLMENHRLHPETMPAQTQDPTTNPTSADDQHFLEIVKVLLQIFDNDVEIYWIAKEFYACTRDIQAESEKLKELTQTLLKREDIALHNHLEKLGVFGEGRDNDDIIAKWYATGFAGVLSESALVRVWDKICGGSRKIVIFIFLELVKTFRASIISCSTQKDLKTVIKQAKDQDAAIVNKAIKAWQSNKQHSEITVH